MLTPLFALHARHVRHPAAWVRSGCIALIALALASPAIAEQGKLRERLTPEVMAVVYPGAERLGMEEGSPPAIAVFKGDQLVAYVFSTLDIIAAPGYSTTPFDVIAGVDLGGRITGAKVVFHQESMIVHDRVRERQLDTFLAREAGRPLRGGTNALPPDYVDGATISARAMRAAVLTTAGLVLRARAVRSLRIAPTAAPTADTAEIAVPPATIPTLDLETFSIKPWNDLLAEGALVQRRVTSGEVATALANAGAAGAKLDWPLGADDDLYIEFMTALVTPAGIGGNLLGLLKLEDYKRELPSGAHAIYVASNGPYDFLGTKYFRESEGYRFDRLRVIQEGKTFGFVQNDYSLATPIEKQQVTGLFALPAKAGFDPLKPWRLDILINSAGAPPLTVAFGLDYKVPEAYVLQVPDPRVPMPKPEPPPEPQLAPQPEPVPEPELLPPVAPWVEAWSEARTNIAILAVLLSLLTLIFIFQAMLARSRVVHRLVRTGFLLVVLVWLGWTAGVQLSIVNVINYVRAPFTDVDIGFYLAEPLMVIIAGYALVSVLLIGRGVFCGWLCPFGALQELLAQLSRALRVPQWHPPVALEKRLWMGKYLAAAAVLALVMTEIDITGASLEIEPFKTAITTKFTRAWPYLLYAGAVLAIGLFSERAYCRFLCPLGGVLAFLDRLHLLNLLERRPECGSACHLCERGCPVRAIEPTGKIVTAECFQCLDCQVEYHDEKRCPPLVRVVRLRREAQPAAVRVTNA
jgi:NosR/NirI family transcriptional regulator, nitrous oxide reductase regulator